MKSERMAKRSSFGTIVRKRLSDISNVLPQPKSPINLEKPSPGTSSSKQHINHLLKENVALVKIIQDKNKIIELSGIEIQKLRISLQKFQLQNWSLAQSNTHMQTELNLGKEKLKSLQHEVMCKEALLKAKTIEPLQDKSSEVKGGGNEGRRQNSIRSQSLGHSVISQQEAAENKRRCVRRKSASVRIKKQEEEEEVCEDLFELDVKVSSSPMQLQRASIGRPSRKAAEKVQSYKETPINVKMRRSSE